MDQFENKEPWQKQPAAYKKASPFENSPYVSPFTHSQQDSAFHEPWQNPPVAPKRKREKRRSYLPFFLLTIGLVIGACLITAGVVNQRWEKEMDLLSQVNQNKITALQQQIKDAFENIEAPANPTPPDGTMTPAQVYDACSDSVVLVSSTVTDNSGQLMAYTGTGFVISADGYVVTNYHVVAGGKTLSITMTDGKTYDVKLVGYEDANDIALLKAEASDLPFVKMGSSSALQVGEQVVAIGNPLGELTSTLTVGYISAKDRVITTEGTSINMLQTDAAINSGNSGGPLFNMYGQVVGITTSKYSGTSNSGATIEGISFAIPMDDVAGMLEDLKQYGYITGAYLGVMVRDVNSYGQSYGLPAGAYVTEVPKGYAAEKAGVKANDIIVNLGGYDITSISDISRVLRKFKAGDTTTITVYRNGKEIHLSITLDEKPREDASSSTVVPDNTPEEGDFDAWYEFFKKYFGMD